MEDGDGDGGWWRVVLGPVVATGRGWQRVVRRCTSWGHWRVLAGLAGRRSKGEGLYHSRDVHEQLPEHGSGCTLRVACGGIGGRRWARLGLDGYSQCVGSHLRRFKVPGQHGLERWLAIQHIPHSTRTRIIWIGETGGGGRYQYAAAETAWLRCLREVSVSNITSSEGMDRDVVLASPRCRHRRPRGHLR